tara:strand:+ start:412 stop:576 length:165 start_codon:yes stop_codon:yes gene_type:complete
MQRKEHSVGSGQTMRTETGRDRSDVKPSNEALMGKEMKDTGVSRSISKDSFPGK